MLARSSLGNAHARIKSLAQKRDIRAIGGALQPNPWLAVEVVKPRDMLGPQT